MQTHRAHCSRSYRIATFGNQSSWSLQGVQSSQHDLISHLVCANALNRCIVVITSSTSIHRTRRLGNENCVQKLVAQASVSGVEGPMCRWHLLSGEPGFTRELVSWLTNHPHLAQVLDQWREHAFGAEPDRHVQVKNRLTSA